MSLLIFGINILLVLAIWHFMIRRTVLDHARDKLFDLRDEVREAYKANGWDMSSNGYKNLRDSINSFLRYTENYSVWAAVSLHTRLNNKPELRDFLVKRSNSKFETSNEEQDKFIKTIRERAQWTLMEFSVYSSGLLMLVFVIFIPVLLAKACLDLLNRSFTVSVSALFSDMRKVNNALGWVIRSAARKTASFFIDAASLDAAASGLGKVGYSH